MIVVLFKGALILSHTIDALQKLTMIGSCVSTCLNQVLENDEITFEQWMILNFLEQHGKVEILNLQCWFTFDEKKLHSVLDALETKNLITCERIYGAVEKANITALGKQRRNKVLSYIQRYAKGALHGIDYTLDDEPIGVISFVSNLDTILRRIQKKQT